MEEAAVAEDIPDWLQGLAEDETEPVVEAEPEPTAEVEEAAVAEDIPDWLQGLAEDEEPEPVVEAEPEPSS